MFDSVGKWFKSQAEAQRRREREKRFAKSAQQSGLGKDEFCRIPFKSVATAPATQTTLLRKQHLGTGPSGRLRRRSLAAAAAETDASGSSDEEDEIQTPCGCRCYEIAPIELELSHKKRSGPARRRHCDESVQAAALSLTPVPKQQRNSSQPCSDVFREFQFDMPLRKVVSRMSRFNAYHSSFHDLRDPQSSFTDAVRNLIAQMRARSLEEERHDRQRFIVWREWGCYDMPTCCHASHIKPRSEHVGYPTESSSQPAHVGSGGGGGGADTADGAMDNGHIRPGCRARNLFFFSPRMGFSKSVHVLLLGQPGTEFAGLALPVIIMFHESQTAPGMLSCRNPGTRVIVPDISRRVQWRQHKSQVATLASNPRIVSPRNDDDFQSLFVPVELYVQPRAGLCSRRRPFVTCWLLLCLLGTT